MIIFSPRVISFFEFILRMRIRALAFYPFIFLSNEEDKENVILINHERIHLRQQLELLIIPFYLFYLFEFYTKGYYETSFEKEAYENENNLNYLKSRKLFSFAKYIKK